MSTRDQDPTLARDGLRAAARARGYQESEVVEVEEVGSGRRADRPGWSRLLASARAGGVGVVLAWRLDRLGRSVVDLLTQIRALRAAGVGVVVVGQGLEIQPRGDAVSDLLLTMLAAVAEFERALIAERTADALAARRRRGIRLGRTPTVPASTVRVAAELRAAGASWGQIAAALQLRGHGRHRRQTLASAVARAVVAKGG